LESPITDFLCLETLDNLTMCLGTILNSKVTKRKHKKCEKVALNRRLKNTCLQYENKKKCAFFNLQKHWVTQIFHCSLQPHVCECLQKHGFGLGVINQFHQVSKSTHIILKNDEDQLCVFKQKEKN
jgi:hypothetical protein